MVLTGCCWVIGLTDVPQTGYNQLPQGQQITQMPQSGQYQSQQQQQPSQQRMVTPMMSQVPVNPMTQQQPELVISRLWNVRLHNLL
jgi:hypothetical protein